MNPSDEFSIWLVFLTLNQKKMTGKKNKKGIKNFVKDAIIKECIILIAVHIAVNVIDS